MIIVDTSVWIEFFKKKSDYYLIVKNLLEKQKIIGIDCIFGELLQGAKNKREIEIITEYWRNLPKNKINNLWIEAGTFFSHHKLYRKRIGLIDCVIIISARRNKARIWSLDEKLNSILEEQEIFKPGFYQIIK